MASRTDNPGEVSPAELAKLSGYTKQQVIKWWAMGLGKLGRTVGTGKKKRLLIPREAGLQWIKGNAVGIAGGHGGKRANSGRQKKRDATVRERGESKASGTRHQASVLEPSAQCPVPSAPAAPRRLTPPRNVESASFLPPGHPDEGKAAPAREARGYVPPTPESLLELTPIEVKQRLDIEKILSERVTRGEKEGTLISVEDARKEWTDACTAVARVLGKMRDTLTSRLITDLGLPSDRSPRLRIVIEQEAAHVLRALRTASFGPDVEGD